VNWKYVLVAMTFWLAAAAAPAANEFAGWVEYRSPDGVFSLSFPGKATASTRAIGQGPAAQTEIRSTDNSFSLLVHEFPIPPGAVVAGDPLDYMTRTDRKDRTVDYVKVISLGAVPGREMYSSQAGLWMRERFYWFENKLYNLVAVSDTKNENERYDQHFFESFRFNAK
jgi:hypothetical protein